MKYILFFCFIILLLNSCKKNEKATLFVSGVIYNNCQDKQPMAGYNFRLFQTNGGANQNGDIIATGKTDENGHFKIFFPPAVSINTMKLQSGSGYDLMTGIPPTENWENVEVFGSIKANIKVSLNVINPHAIGDTLDIKYLGAPASLKIPCPVASGSIYTAIDYVPVNAMGFQGTEDYISHGFIPSTGFSYDTYFKIDKYCQDTVFVTVNIE